MTADHLKAMLPEGEFYYVASPYTLYPNGLWEANRVACKAAAWLAKHHIPAFSPIAHSHALCQHSSISAVDGHLWLGLDYPIMRAAFGLIVVKAVGWDKSVGVGKEIDQFTEWGRPIEFMEPVEGL